MIAGVLEVQMMANLARFQADMTSAKGMAGTAMKSIESAVESAVHALEMLGVGLSIGALIEHTKAILEAGDAMNDLSQRVGIAVQDLAKYELATAQSGTTMEALAKGVKGISVNLLEHGDALKKAGLSATTADGAILQLADIFKSMPDGMEKTALAVKMFGKSGMDLIPMLNMGSEGLKEAADKSAKYAATMSALAPQADKFNDNMAELGMLSKVAGMSLVSDMLPGLIAVAKAMSEAAQEGGMFKAAFTGLNELAWESWGRSLEILRLKANAWFAELEAKKQHFLWGDNAAAGDYQNQANEAYLRIQQLAASAPKAAAAATPAAVPAFDTKKYLADYKAIMAALGIGGTTTTTVDPYIKLQEAAVKYLDSLKKEAAQLGMTDVEKKLYDANVIALTLHKGAEQAAFTASTTALIKEADAYKKAVEVSKERADLRKKESDSIAAYMVAEKISLLDAAHNAEDAVKQAQLEYDTIGMLKSGVQALTLARMQDSLTNQSVGSDAYNSLMRQIEAQKQLIGITKNIEVKTTENTFAQTLHDDVKNALSTAFRDTKNPIKAFGDALGNVIFTRVANSLADAMATQILGNSYIKAAGAFFGMFGGGSGSGGSGAFVADAGLASNADWYASMIGFDGGGYTGSGARSGGLDGMGGFMAVMHPQETVIDHTRGQSANDSGASQKSGGGQPIVVNQYFTVGDVASISMVKQAVAGSEKRIVAGIGRSMQYGGALS